MFQLINNTSASNRAILMIQVVNNPFNGIKVFTGKKIWEYDERKSAGMFVGFKKILCVIKIKLMDI